MITALSFWMMDKFNYLSLVVSEKQVPELYKSSNLHLAIKNVHRKMDAIAHVKSKAENRVIVQELSSELRQITFAIDNITNDKYSKLMSAMTKELLPIVNSYSLEIDRLIDSKTDLYKQIIALDDAYINKLMDIEPHKVTEASALNQLYTSVRFLPDYPTTFLFMRAKNNIINEIKHLKNRNVIDGPLFELIDHPQNGIIAILQEQGNILANLSVLNTQTNVIIEQLIAISFDKVNVVKNLVKEGTQALNSISSNYTKALVSIVLFITIFTIAFMYIFHQSVSKRLIVLANSISCNENHEMLQKETQGGSEISIIAKSFLKYIARNERQKSEIRNNAKQLMLIIENSNQVVIIYSEDRIVYCNQCCEQLLDVNAMTNTDIISQNLLIAINTITYKDRLQVGPYVFRFFATDIDWNGKTSTLALLIDITEDVNKENQLIKRLEKIKDESLIDTLSGLYNRRKLEVFAEQQIESDYALIIADIDWFKAFNDLYGRTEGDECIIKVAMAIKGSLLTDDDLAVRYGGEEFLVILINSSMSQAKLVAEKIQSIIQNFEIKHEKSEFNQLSLSLGVAHSSEIKSDDWQALFDIADKRLYQAKANGRARTVSSGEYVSLHFTK
ncbi:MAG: GGDEF domain-containing protein [Oceanospirillaceae bacterium]